MEKILKPSKYVPYDPNVQFYSQSDGQCLIPVEHCGLHPYQYSSFWDEMLASHEGCYIHAGLNPAASYYVKGPDALKLYSDICVNSFANFPIGKGKHGVMCNEQGYLVKDGMVLRLSEDEIISFWMLPYIEYKQKKGSYDVISKDMTGKLFFYQLAGPTSLDLIEKATGESFGNLKFSNFRKAKIKGREILILRMGMAGALAYEVHGYIEDALTIYETLMQIGKDYGIRKIGRRTYINVHTEGGFPQQSIHFTSALNDEEYVKWMKEEKGCWGSAAMTLSGSMGNDISKRWVTPVDVGWGHLIKFDHEFTGKDALKKALEKPTKTPVTLVWNEEDILDIWRSMFESDEPYATLDMWDEVSPVNGTSEIHGDQVLVGDKLIGISSGRMYSPTYRVMISLGFIDPAYSLVGTEVEILWGNPGTKQKRILATISRYPFENTGGHVSDTENNN